jgi:SAM-dependent methyltransferase
MLDLLRGDARLPLGDQRILEIGCAGGKTLTSFLRYGADPANLVGVDLLTDEIERARSLAPHLQFEVADARALPFADASFDLVLAFTVLSSIQSPGVRDAVCGEIRRVLHRDGAALIYDFSVAGRVNRDTRPLRLRDIRERFPGWEVRARRVTLLPPLARWLAPRSWLLCELLGALPGLRTHWLVLVRPEAAASSLH